MILNTLIIFIIVIIASWLYIRYQLPKRKRKNTIAFFHLYCSSGGGGERVLWHTIEALVKKYPNYTIYIYSHKNIHDDTLRILQKVRDLFRIDLISNRNVIDNLEFVPLRCSPWLEAKRYPILTLFFQNFMSIFVALEAAYRIAPEIYFETIGFTYTLPVFKLLYKSTVITYVHYPTISSDMIKNVKTNTHASYNNRQIFVRSPVMRSLKLVYYRILAYLYGKAGQQADLVMVNSTWTQNHIESLWNRKAHVVYPPCDVESFKKVFANKNREKSKDGLNIISIAQFRPEKNHQLQIEAFDIFLSRTGYHESRLMLYGGCRDEEDQKRVNELKDLIERLDLLSNVEIIVGASFDKLLDGVKEAEVAIHTMKNEHFGIVLLEFMAAGLITVAHDSGGPKTDIIDDNASGFLADDVEDFANKLIQISRMSSKERIVIQQNAIKKSDQFSSKKFEDKFIMLVGSILLN